MNYYNEFDKNAAAWLRELIAMKAIPDGHVDERSIIDVALSPEDLKGYTQCHFFAGIAGWSLALERAGIPATRPLWTGSCPCQAFSCAGKQQGTEDHRDLWPVFFGLIQRCRPERVFGEQVEAAVGFGWLDRLQTDLEAEGYATGAVVLGAHSAGADHQRQRLYWVADAAGLRGAQHEREHGRSVRRETGPQNLAERGSDHDRLANAQSIDGRGEQQAGRTRGGRGGLAGSEPAGRMADVSGERCGETRERDVRSPQRTCDGREYGGVGNAPIDRPEVREHVHGEMQRFGSDEGCESGLRLENPARVGRRGRSDGDSTGHGGTLQVEGPSTDGGLGDTESGEDIGRGRNGVAGEEGSGTCGDHAADLAGDHGGVGDSKSVRPEGLRTGGLSESEIHVGQGLSLRPIHDGRNFWSNAVAIPCRDNCFRRAEPGVFPLVARIPKGVVPSGDPRLSGYADETSEGRVMRLKGYGNAINVETAKLFIQTCEEVFHVG